MYDVNGLPPIMTSTRRSASCGVTWTKFGADAAAACASAARLTPIAGTSIRAIFMAIFMALRMGGAPLSGEHTAHVGERLLHARERIVGVDLVLEVDVARVGHGRQRRKERGNGQHACTDDALAVHGAGAA